MEIVFKNVSYRYKNKSLLDHINLTIEGEKITGIIGKQKTLLSELIGALHLNYTGTITVDDVSLNSESFKKIHQEIGFIYQNWQDQFYTDNLKEEVLFLVSRLDYQTKNVNQKIEQALTMVGLDHNYNRRKISTLSSGEKKLLQIATCLISNPKVIVLDEPFVELDYISQKRIIQLLKLLKEKYHKTIIIASNDDNLLYEITDNIIILQKGHILIHDQTTKVYQDIDFLKNHHLEIPNLIQFTALAKEKKVKLSYHRDIRDLIKDVYKHVSK